MKFFTGRSCVQVVVHWAAARAGMATWLPQSPVSPERCGDFGYEGLAGKLVEILTGQGSQIVDILKRMENDDGRQPTRRWCFYEEGCV